MPVHFSVLPALSHPHQFRNGQFIELISWVKCVMVGKTTKYHCINRNGWKYTCKKRHLKQFRFDHVLFMHKHIILYPFPEKKPLTNTSLYFLLFLSHGFTSSYCMLHSNWCYTFFPYMFWNWMIALNITDLTLYSQVFTKHSVNVIWVKQQT